MSVNENIPNAILLAAANAEAERKKEIATAHFNLSETLRHLRDACIKEIRSAIDPEKLQDYEKAREMARQRFREVAAATLPTTESLKQAAELRRQISNEGKQFVDGLGIDAKKIRGIQEKYASEAESLVKRTLLLEEEAPYVEVSAEKAPTLSHNPWEWRSPPYAGDASGYWQLYTTTPPVYPHHYENRLTGEISLSSRMWVPDADDSDLSYTEIVSYHTFWYLMPAAGLLEVWLLLEAAETYYGGCLDDEWGVSNARVLQRSRPFLLTRGRQRFATLLEYDRGNVEGCWSHLIAPPGGQRWVHLFSLDPFAQGEWVSGSVGISDFNYFWVNDMSCSLILTSRWVLKQIVMRSTGAP